LFLSKLYYNLIYLLIKIVQYGLPPDRRTIGKTDQGPSVKRTLIYEDNRQDTRPIGRAATPKPGSIIRFKTQLSHY